MYHRYGVSLSSPFLGGPRLTSNDGPHSIIWLISHIISSVISCYIQLHSITLNPNMLYSRFSIDLHRIMSLNHVTPPILVIFTMVSRISHAPSMPRFWNIGANEISQRHRQERGHGVGRNGAQKHGHGAFRAALGTQRRGRDEGAIADFRGEDQEEGLVDGRYWKDLGQFFLDVLVLASKTSELDFRPWPCKFTICSTLPIIIGLPEVQRPHPFLRNSSVFWGNRDFASVPSWFCLTNLFGASNLNVFLLRCSEVHMFMFFVHCV